MLENNWDLLDPGSVISFASNALKEITKKHFKNEIPDFGMRDARPANAHRKELRETQ